MLIVPVRVLSSGSGQERKTTPIIAAKTRIPIVLLDFSLKHPFLSDLHCFFPLSYVDDESILKDRVLLFNSNKYMSFTDIYIYF